MNGSAKLNDGVALATDQATAIANSIPLSNGASGSQQVNGSNGVSQQAPSTPVQQKALGFPQSGPQTPTNPQSSTKPQHAFRVKAATPAVAPSTPSAQTQAQQAPRSQPQVAQQLNLAVEGGSLPTKPPKIVKKRLRKIEAKPKLYDKILWLAGHGICIAGSLIYAFYYFTFRSHKSWVSVLSYRFAFLGVVIAYSVTLVNLFGKIPPSYFTLLTTENFQYLTLAGVWFFNRSSFFKILPYTLISVLQLSTFFKVKPVLKFDHYFKEIIVYDELFLFVLLFVDTLLMRGTSGYALVVFTLFYSMKVVFNDETKGLVFSVIIKADGVMSKQKNPKVQSLWHDIKSFFLKKKERAEAYNFQIKKE